MFVLNFNPNFSYLLVHHGYIDGEQKKKGLPSSNPEWRTLQTKLLESIFDHLAPTEDYLAFSEVCIGWRSAVLQKLQQLRSNHKSHCRQHHRVPLLMFPSCDHGRNKYWLCDVVKRRQLRPSMEESWASDEWRCEGSSHGWLILFHHNSGEVILREPFSGREIRLPPFREPLGLGEHICTVLDRQLAGRRYAFSIDPYPDLDNQFGFGFAILMTSGDGIGFFKPGNEEWTYIEIEDKLRGDISFTAMDYSVLKGCGVLYSIYISSCDNFYYKVKRIISPDHENAVPNPFQYAFPDPSHLAALDPGIQGNPGRPLIFGGIS